MKHLALILTLLCFAACSNDNTENPDPKPKEDIVIPNNTPQPTFGENGGSSDYRFTAHNAWTADVAATRAIGWCRVSPTSGGKGEIILSIVTDPNETPNERNATVTLKSGATKKTFSVTQKQKDALTITSSKIEMESGGGNFAVEIKANISFDYELGADCKEWISYTGTRALKTSRLEFNVAENDDTAVREGTITIRSSEGSETVKVYQAGGTPAIILTQKDYTVAAEGETIKVELKSNVDYTVTMPQVGWIKESTTRAMSTHTLYYTISANEDYDGRTAEIIFTNKSNNLTQKVTITQVQKDAIVLAKSEYEFGADGGVLDFDVMTNVELTVAISAEAKSWIAQVQTRGLEKEILHFDISACTQDDDRTGTISITGGGITQKVTVTQSGLREVLAKERAALVALYNATDGKNWSNNINWCSDKDISTWQGVTVENRRVTKLVMVNNNLSGPLPASIGDLTALKQLLLAGEDTYLSGSIPGEICNLTELEYLELAGPELTGPLPSEIGKLKKLEFLQLGKKINGEIPESFYDCENLVIVNLSASKISGVISPKIGQLKKLKILGLAQSDISGSIPPEIGQCESLQELGLSETKISGTIPVEICNLKNLQVLLLYSTGISGEIPSRICDISTLKTLAVGRTQLTGPIPSDIGRLTNLQVLNVERCNLTGTLPESIGECTKLTLFTINNNKLSGSIPASISRIMNNLDLFSPTGNTGRFYIEQNNFTGQIPDAIINHANFALIAFRFLLSQNPGYGFDFSNFRFPARTQTYTDIDGNPINMGETYSKNKYTLVFRYGIDCPYSTPYLPLIKSLQSKYGDKGLKIILSISMPYMPTNLKAEITKQGLQDFPHFIEVVTNKVLSPYFVEYAGCFSTPFATIVDNKGEIQFITLTEKTDLYDKNYKSVYPIDEVEGFIYKLFGAPDKPYESTDYSADGKVTTLQKATRGNGINIALMGDAYSDRLIADGTYEKTMRKAMDYFFTEEPYKSYRDCFNVYSVNVVSKNEEYGSGMQTALSGYFGNGTHVGGNDSKCMDYAKKVPGITDNNLNSTLVIVMMNRKYYAGTCYMYYPSSGDYSQGLSVSYFPFLDDEDFKQTLHHEAGGHGFPKLADEYSYQQYGEIPPSEIANKKQLEPYGWWKNADFTGDMTKIKWSKFISDPRYAAEALGAYEGGLTYWSGVWRPTVTSIMRYNTGGFNAPSREAIYYRIHKLAYGSSWTYDFEEFVKYDAVNRTGRAPMLLRTPIAKPKNFVPLHPPVVIMEK